MNKLLNSIADKKTVFDTRDLSILWGISNSKSLKSKIHYWVKHKKLINLHKGIYTINTKYNILELASKLHNPSYISLETILRQEGCIFQYDTAITSISNISKNYLCNQNFFSYRKIKDSVLLNSSGLIIVDHYMIATLERAFLDMLYLNTNYYFDNLSKINWNKCQKLVSIYQNKQLERRLQYYKKEYVK